MGLEEAQGGRVKPPHAYGHEEKLEHGKKPGVQPGKQQPGLCPSFELGGCVTRGTREDPGNGCRKGNTKYTFLE